MHYKMAAEGKELDGGMGYDQASKDGTNNDAGMGYSMGGGQADKDGGMSYSMGGGKSSKDGGMDYDEANSEGKVSEDGYTQNAN